MKSLEARKEELLMACRIQREVLALEIDVLRLHAATLRRKGRQVGDVWKWLAPLSGLLLARRIRRSGRIPMAGSFKWVLLYKAFQWWWHYRQQRQQPPRREGASHAQETSGS